MMAQAARPQSDRSLALVRVGRLLVAFVAALGISCALGAGAQGATTQPWWHLDMVSAPTNLEPHHEAVIEVIATNLGDAPVNAEKELVTITDKLPASSEIKAIAVSGHLSRTAFFGEHTTESEEEAASQLSCPKTTAEVEKEQTEKGGVSCTYNKGAQPEAVDPYQSLLLEITVKVEGGSEATLENEATVQGGGAPPVAPDKTALKISATPTPFGVSRFEMVPEGEGGGSVSQAGSHAYGLTTTLDFNLTREIVNPLQGPLPALPALPRNLSFHLPPGLLGNPTAVERCTAEQFATILGTGVNLCPAKSAIGVAVIHLDEPQSFRERVLAVPVFDLEPAFGEPARFGFFGKHVLVYIDTSVNPEEEYAATASITNATQVAYVLSSVVTLWGSPGSPVHDSARGWECVEGEEQAEKEFVNNGGKHGEFTHCKTLEDNHEKRSETPFVILPTRCKVPGLHTRLEGISYPPKGATEGIVLNPQNALIPEITECGSLEFNPAMEVQPENPATPGGPLEPIHTGSTPSGLSVDVHVPQTGTLSEEGRAPSAVKATKVELPVGVLLNAGAANGLLACSPGPLGVKPGFESEAAVTTNEGFTGEIPHCFDEELGAESAAKVGTFTIKTPLISHLIHGSVFLGIQDTGGSKAEAEKGEHFNPPLVLYLMVNDPEDGLVVKLAGAVTPEPANGQLVSTFQNTPQLPFEDLKLHFFEEGRASATTPGRCGPYATKATFTPWSGAAELPFETFPRDGKHPGAEDFEITTGPNGLPCGPVLPLSPSITAGPAPAGTNLAGHYSPLDVIISRPDGDQQLTELTVTLPPGIAAVLANVTPCGEPQAEEGTCGQSSLIGEATTVSGLGPEPFTLRGGKVYLTEGYKGAPYGLSIAFPNIVAGPFHVGTVVVRASISVNEFTAQVTVNSVVPTFVETMPGHVRKGIPVQLKQTVVETFGTLPGGEKHFEFNPTSCSPLSALAGFKGEEGGISSAFSTLQFAGCEKLEFSPGFEAEVEGHGSKPNGVGFKVITTSNGIGVANIHRVHVALPIQLPSRLTTIQQACLLKTFNEGAKQGEKCDEGSNIGSAHIETPVLKNPLSGPAYLVSHGNEEFPDVEFVLKGTGTPGESAIKLILDGKTDIKAINGRPCPDGKLPCITFSTFESTPDAPFTRFETTLPAGPHSAFTANVPESKRFNLCGEKLVMPTEITGQNGVLIQEQTIVKVTGCPPAVHLTKAQLLAKALATCRKHYKHNKKKRKSCERAARKKYGAKKASKKASHKAARRAVRGR